MDTIYPNAVAMALHIVPLLVGMFLGAPVLARPVSDSGPVRILDAMLNQSAGPMNPGPPGSLLLRGWYTGPDGHRLIGASADRLLSVPQHITSVGQRSSWLAGLATKT